VTGVRGVVPQVVNPAARLAQRVAVGAAEKVGLHVHLQDVELAGRDLLVDVLVTRVEAPDVAAHRDQAAALGQRHDVLGTLERVGQRNFHLHMLAGRQAGRQASVCSACRASGGSGSTSSIAPRAISHMTSSIPSAPASRA